MSDNERLDIHVAKLCGLSREKAREAIVTGKVTVNGKTVTKPSHAVSYSDSILLIGDAAKYVSRGGCKLEKALEVFGIDLSGKTCADIGASTGGFTDCMLKNGAKKVYAIENGTSQLAESLRNDQRVVSLEQTDIRDIFSLGEEIDLLTCDLSFLSVTKVLRNIKSILSEKGLAIILIKPQYELNSKQSGKNDIFHSKKLHKKILSEVIAAMESEFSVCGLTFSPISGKSGNIEYLALITHNPPPSSAFVKNECFFSEIVENAFAEIRRMR